MLAKGLLCFVFSVANLLHKMLGFVPIAAHLRMRLKWVSQEVQRMLHHRLN